MFTMQEHVEDLQAHIRRVQQNALTLAHALISQGRSEFARVLLANAHVHDASKWHGIEWDHMHAGPDGDAEMLSKAIQQHQKINPHHPEYWGGLSNMPEIFVAEMVCDWLARAQEFASDFWLYVTTTAAERFKFREAPQQAKWIEEYAKLLLPDKFNKKV